MRKFSVVLLILTFAVTSLVFAADPQHRNRDRNRGQTCDAVLRGGVETIAGTVASIGHHQSMVVETAEETQVKIYGIGPYWYWDANDMDKPTVGDAVDVSAFAVPFADGIRYVAQSITVGGQTIELRDLNTGCPLWRTSGHH